MTRRTALFIDLDFSFLSPLGSLRTVLALFLSLALASCSDSPTSTSAEGNANGKEKSATLPGAVLSSSEWAQRRPSGPRDLRWPVARGIRVRIVNGYGGSRYHQGCRYHALDLQHEDESSTLGTWVLTAGRGWVHDVGWDSTRGNHIVIDHGAGLYTEYDHLLCDLSPFFRKGDDLAGGTYVGKIGTTGAAGGVPHLHFVVMVYDEGCCGKPACKRSIPVNGIDGDNDLCVDQVYTSSNVTVTGPRGFYPGRCN